MPSCPSASIGDAFSLEFSTYLATADGAVALQLVITTLKHHHSEQVRLSGEYGNHADCPKPDKHTLSPCVCCPTCCLLATAMLWLLKQGLLRAVAYAGLLAELTLALSLDAQASRARYGVPRKSVDQAISDAVRYLGARLGLGARPYDDLLYSRRLRAALFANVAVAGTDTALDGSACPEVQLRVVAVVAKLCQLRAIHGDTHTPFPWQRAADQVNTVLRMDAGLRDEHREMCALRAQLPAGSAGRSVAAQLNRKIARLDRSIAKRGIVWSGPDITGDQVQSIVKTVGDVVARWGSDKLDNMLKARVFAHLGQDHNIDAVESKSVFDEVEVRPAFAGQNIGRGTRFGTGDLEQDAVTRCWRTARYLHPGRHEDGELDHRLVALARTHLPASLDSWALEHGIDYSGDALAAIAPGEPEELTAAVVDRVAKVLQRRLEEGARRRRVVGLRARAARRSGHMRPECTRA